VAAELVDSAVEVEARLMPARQLRLRRMQMQMVRIREMVPQSVSAEAVDADKPMRWTVER